MGSVLEIAQNILLWFLNKTGILEQQNMILSKNILSNTAASLKNAFYRKTTTNDLILYFIFN